MPDGFDAAATAFVYGRWGDALREAGQSAAADPKLHALCAAILLGRGDMAGAAAASQRAMDLAEGSDGVSARVAVLCARGAVDLASGRRADAERAAADLAGVGRILPLAVESRHPTLTDVAWLFVDLGRGADLREALEGAPGSDRWVDAARAVIDGRTVRAAELMEAAGHPAGVAYARLRAAERMAADGRPLDAAEQARRAAAFYRTAGASAFWRRAEAIASGAVATPLDR
jgi:hypothetical protein